MDSPFTSSTSVESVASLLRRQVELLSDVSELQGRLDAWRPSELRVRNTALDRDNRGSLPVIPRGNNASYKLLQILQISSPSREAIVCYDLCGAPGGFVAALRWAYKGGVDCVGITKIDEEDYPFAEHWKIQKDRRIGTSGTLKFAQWCGKTGSLTRGDIFCVDVLESLLHLGGGPRPLVLADGAFSLKGRWDQHNYLSDIFYREACLGVRLTSPGGTFVIKMLAPWTPFHAGVLVVLETYFDGCELVKPPASRATNSEVYAYCTGRNNERRPLESRGGEIDNARKTPAFCSILSQIIEIMEEQRYALLCFLKE